MHGSFELHLTSHDAALGSGYAALLGYGSAPVREGLDRWLDRCHPSDLEPLRSALDRCASGDGGSFQLVVGQRANNGTWRTIRLTVVAVEHDAEGRALRLAGDAVYVTDAPPAAPTIDAQSSFARAERALQFTARELAEAQRLAAVGSWSLYADGRFQWSDQMYRLFHLTPDSPIPSPEDFIGRIHPDDRAAVQAAFDSTLAGVPASNVQYRVTDAEGHLRFMRASAEPRVEQDGSAYVAGVTQDVTDLHDLMESDGHGEVVCLLGAFEDITDRRNAEMSLLASLREKDALLLEVHHRVKNNLQIMSSLLRLEASRRESPDVKGVLGEMQNRILSMAVLHELLYRSSNVADVDLAAYLDALARHIFGSLAPPGRRVELALTLAPTRVAIDLAVPCGLLVNELMSNSLKHAFPDQRSGQVSVELARVDDRTLRLVVSDTGIGLPDHFDLGRTPSLGLQLVSDLARQLRATLEVGPTGPGASFTLILVLRPASARPL
ncbi:MAG: histidine kinase dimerization/phosphoacceptor domain -containing protein [Vicinamibacterales bacterium]